MEFEECFRFPRKQMLGYRWQYRRLWGCDNVSQGITVSSQGDSAGTGMVFTLATNGNKEKVFVFSPDLG